MIYIDTENGEAVTSKEDYVKMNFEITGAGRVDIDEDEGYLVELDTYYDEEPKFKTTNLQLPVMIKTPELASSSADDPGYAFVRDSLNGLDAALTAGDFPDSGYRDLIDMDTFMKFLMVNEIVSNGELGHPKSTCLYKDSGGLISAGPLRDFDWAFSAGGNRSVNNHVSRGRYYGGWFFDRLFYDPVFTAQYKTVWTLHCNLRHPVFCG